jgi:hypothetical protein
MLTKARRPAFRTIDGWAICVPLEAGTIHECEEHRWMRDRSDPHAWQEALRIARAAPFVGLSANEAVAAVRAVLESVGDACRSASG